MTPRDAALGGLGILSLALLVTIAAELLAAPAPIAAVAASVPKSPLPVAAVDESPKLLPIILARPLFAIDRRPKASPTAGGGIVDDEVPRLSGILIDQAPHAIFQPSGADAKPLKVDVGDTVAGWQIQGITADSVTLTGPKGTQTLQPKPDPALATPAPGNGALNVPGFVPRPPPNAPRQVLPGGMQLPAGVPNPFIGQTAPSPGRPNIPQPPSRQPGGAPAVPNHR
jgi:hypothetical protein